MIVVVMTTYVPEGEGAVRGDYAVETSESLEEHLKCSSPMRLHVADDGSPDASFLHRMIPLRGVPITSTNAERGGIGRSLNLALATIKDDEKWLYSTDDWKLIGPLHIDKVEVLIDLLGYDVVRLGPLHPELSLKTKFQRGVGWWMDIDVQAGGFAFATRPFVATKQFWHKVGPFDEGLDSYETERLYCERAARAGIRIAAINMTGPWKHIGKYDVGKYAPTPAAVA